MKTTLRAVLLFTIAVPLVLYAQSQIRMGGVVSPLENRTYLGGSDTFGVARGIIGINAANNIQIDPDDRDVVFGDDVTVDGTLSVTGIQTFTGALNLLANLIFEGATADANETTVTVTDPTADRTVTIPDSTFTVGQVEVTYTMLANGSLADQSFFVATRAYQVTAVSEVHATAGTDGSAVNVQVVKDTSTDAPGGGTDLLTNNSNAGFNMKGTANTVQTGTLTGTVASLQLAAGDRLSVDFAGTLTTLAGVTVTVSLRPN